MIISQHQHMYH